MKNFVPFIILSLLISLIAISTYKLSHEQNSKEVIDEAMKEENYRFLKTKIKLKNFSLQSLLDSDTLKKLDLRKNEYIILNFFASWCTTCMAEHPILLQLKEANIVKMYGIAWHDINENSKFFLNKYGNPYDKVFIDSKSELGDIVGIKAIPETMIVKNGEVIYRYKGNLQEFHIEDIRKIVK
ncbi:MAG: redoxin family protein [Rickettsiales bacterium]|nr:redoxin family protein [Rickettsiales bacterium]